jgi:NitT/TauT family transport system substrate-binding protein
VIRFAALLVSTTVFVEAHAFAQLTKLNVGYVGITSDNAAAFIARDTGIYARNGLDVQLIYMNSGSTAVAALISGDTPITQTAGPGVINASMNGSDTVMIAGGNVTLDYWMLSRPEIKTAEQLKGGAVAISRFGSLSEFLTRSALRQAGVDPKDVTMVQIGATPARFTTLAGGMVDATILWFPVTERAKAAGLNKLFDLKDLYPNWTNVGFIARESWLAKEKEQATRFLRAYQRGVKHTRENRDDGIRALRKYVGLNAGEAAAGYDEYRDSFPMDGRILDAGITATVEQEIETGRLKRKISASEMIDGSFINLFGKK